MQTGGAERILVDLLPHLTRAGVEASVCTLNTHHDDETAAAFEATGARRIDLDADRIFDPAGWWRFRSILEREPFDLVHAQDHASQIIAGFVGRTVGVPVVMTRHVMKEQPGTWRGRCRSRLVLVAARTGAARVVAVSDAVRREFSRQARIPLDRIERIHNGIDTAFFRRKYSAREARSVLGWDPDRPVVAMISVLRPRKGHEVLFEAVPALREVVPDVAVKVVGSGSSEATIRARAGGLERAVEFLGPRRDVRTILEASEVVVLPSWTEGLPTVALEAGAMGVPVVACNVGGVPEVVDEGETGFLVEAGDAAALADRIGLLLRDRERADRLGRQARERIERDFSLDAQAAATRAVYDEVLAAT